MAKSAIKQPITPENTSKVFGDNWPIRRRWMVRILIWAMFNVQAILVNSMARNTDNALLENSLIALLALIVSILGSYVFGSVWDDNNKRQHIAEMQMSPSAGGVDPELIPSSDPAPVSAPDTPPEGYAS